jgi:hypothetical protein
MYLVYVYENTTMKTAEIVLRRGKEQIKENDRGDESN